MSAIRSLAASGGAAEAMALTREAIGLLAGVAESVDDSDGWLGQIGADLADAHHKVCRATRPDPEELAHWLITHAIDDAAGLTDIDPLD